MAILLENKQNVNAPNATFPFGDVKDNSGANDGTPLNRAVLSDYMQFFAKMLDASGVVPNGLLENNTNGFQYFLALVQNIRQTTATTSLSGTSERATQAEMNAGDATRHVTGEIIKNATDIISNLALLDDSVDNDKIQDGSIDSPKIVNGEVTAEKIEPQQLWQSLTLQNGAVVSTAAVTVNSTPAYFKDSLGFVHLKGHIQSQIGFPIIATLPLGYRPIVTMGLIFSRSSNPGVQPRINIDGTISTGQVGGSSSSIILDGLMFPTHT